MFTSGQNGGHFSNTPKTGLTGKICDGTISHINSPISLYNKQFHRYFGLKNA